MQLLWPWLLGFLALPVALVAGYAWSLRRRRPTAARYSSLALIRDAMPRSSRLRRHLPIGLLALSLVALVVALGRPVMVLAVPTNQATIVLAIDVSGSMCSTDIQPTRLQAAEQAAESFIGQQAPGTQIGIVAFGGFAEIVQSPTTDQQTLVDALRSLATGRRTAIGSGILSAIDAIAEADPAVPRSQSDTNGGPAPAPVPAGAYAPDIIVLLTDGASNTGPLPVDAARQAADRGVRIYTIGFGTQNGGALSADCAPQFVGREPGGGAFGAGGFGGGFPGAGQGGFGGPGGGFRRGIDEDTLRQVAQITGGAYYPAESAGQLENVLQGLPTDLIVKHDVVEVSVGFVALGGALAAASVFLGRAWRPLP